MYTSLQYNISKASFIFTILLFSSLLLVTTSLLNYTINTTTIQSFHYTTTNTKCSLSDSTRFCIHKLNIYNQLSNNITTDFFNNFHFIYNWTKHNLITIQSLEYCSLETWKNNYDYCTYSIFKETSLPLLDINYNHTQLDFTKIISKCFQHLSQAYIFSNCLYIQINYPSTNNSKYKRLLSN